VTADPIVPDDLERVATWRDVYDFLYEGDWDADALGEDFAGWRSVYDGSPIPVAEMQEWRNATVARILAFNPRRVLEIGVGDGHVLSQVAAHCDRYVGCDFSEVAIDALRRQLRGYPALDRKIELDLRAAHELDDLAPAGFDAVIVNSVVQYFPSLRYLRTVLDAAVRLLAPGGAVYLGDLRNSRTQRCLATAVALHGDATGTAALRSAVDESISAERELLVDPGFFAEYAADRPSIAAVDVRLRRGHAHNELTRHRYDVVLHDRQAEVLPLDQAPIRRWAGDLDELARQLTVDRPDRVRVVGAPNSRLHAELAAYEAVHTAGDVAAARRARTGPVPAGLPDPEDFHQLGATCGYQVAVTWSPEHPGELDVLFVTPESAGSRAWSGVCRAVDGSH